MEEFLLAVTVTILTIVASGFIASCGGDFHRRQLVNSGHAEYFINAENEKEWRIKECKDGR